MQTTTPTVARKATHLSTTKRLAPRLCLAMLLAAALLTVPARAGVTVITHGWQPREFILAGDPTYPTWVDAMAQAVTNAAGERGLRTTWYHIRVFDGGSGITSSIERKPDAATAPEGEIVVTVNWALLSNHLFSNGVTTDQVAYELAAALRRSYFTIGLASPLASMPLHLVGHSRGASVMAETAQSLGKSGVWVDHLTTLDPHPLTSPDYGIFPAGCSVIYCSPADPPVRLYDNVVFADNYWREDLLAGDLWISSFDFNGQSVPASQDVLLMESILDGLGHAAEHADVHTWYHGTIGAAGNYPASDGDVSITDAWYASPHPARDEGGFAYSRLAYNGLAHRNILRYAISQSHGGIAARLMPDRRGGSQWANIEAIHLPAYPNDAVPQGQPIIATFKYQDRDSGVRVEWFIDADRNPFNNGSSSPVMVQTLDSTGDKVTSTSVSIPTDGMSLTPTRYLLARITSLNNNAVRYDYSDNSFHITWAEFALRSISPDSVVAGAGVTRLTLSGSAFAPDDKVLFFNGTTITPVAPISVTANQIVVDFNFGSTLRTWSLSVQQYYDGSIFRTSDSLPVEVRSSTPTGPTITLQPADATVVFGQITNFTVAATGTGTLTYQWLRNGLTIAGATTATYTTSPVSYANDGYTYLVRVTDANGTTPSRLATLSVVPPTVACNDAMEPNDRSYQATVLPLGVITNGLICSAVDVDWLQVTMTNSGQLNLALTIPGGHDYDLELYGPDFAWMAGSYNQAAQNEAIQRTVAAGDYYVRVYGYQGAYSPSQFYQLSANAGDIQPPGPLSGLITNAVMWSGVVEVTGDVTIVGGGSLRILPGTQVRCASGDDLSSGNDSSRVEIILNGGSLDASGTTEAPSASPAGRRIPLLGTGMASACWKVT